MPSGSIYRIGRTPDAWQPPDWAYAGPGGRFGNRFDDPNGIYRVLYASSQRLGCFLESLAHYRVAYTALARLEQVRGYDDHSGFGVVPAAWLPGRLIGSARAHGEFADICSAAWTAKLRELMAPDCSEHGITEFDVSVTLGPNRRLTQKISQVVYRQAHFVGIRYPSRHAANVDNWALFEPFSQISAAESKPISRTDPDLLTALEIFKLEMR